jgi:RNA polymerase sigma-70 factor (ECF subfamily)
LPVICAKSRQAAENTLVVRAQAGKTLAFDELVRTYRERLYSVVLNLTNHPEDAADLTQEVFIKAFANIRKYNFGSSFYTWLYRIAMNESFNFLRRARRKRMLKFEYFRRDEENSEDPLNVWLIILSKLLTQVPRNCATSLTVRSKNFPTSTRGDCTFRN